jgi:hypothetical protein
MSGQAIALAGNSAIITTNATPNTNNSVPVPLAGSANLGLPTLAPGNIRLLNIGTAVIWFSLTSPAAGTAVIPTAGTTTLGTPQPVIWIAPNVEVVINLSVAIQALTGVAGGPLGFWINTISLGASQTFLMQLGDGM